MDYVVVSDQLVDRSEIDFLKIKLSIFMDCVVVSEQLVDRSEIDFSKIKLSIFMDFSTTGLLLKN